MAPLVPPTLTLAADHSRLVFIDLQDRLLKAIDGADAVVARALVLARAAERLGVPMAATEQNPGGIGPTTQTLGALVPRRFAKVHFSAAEEADFLGWTAGGGTVILAGTETHVCVLQTALGLKALGLRTTVVADACGSRQAADKQAALDRLRFHGVEIVTTEMVVFEWLHRYDRPEFKELLRLIK